MFDAKRRKGCGGRNGLWPKKVIPVKCRKKKGVVLFEYRRPLF